MKKIIVTFLMAAMMLTLTACHDGQAKIPGSSNDFTGKYYEDVKTQLETAGFSNIEEREVVTTDENYKTGDVESVSVNGDTSYKANSWQDLDSKVVVAVYMNTNELKKVYEDVKDVYGDINLNDIGNVMDSAGGLIDSVGDLYDSVNP